MRCSNCGGENESGVNFCQYCGAKLEQESNFSQNDFDKGQAGQTGYDPNYSNQAEYSNQTDYSNNGGYSGQAGYYQLTESQLPEEYRPLTMWGYFGYQLLFCVPCVGFIFLLIIAFGGTRNVNLKNFARSYFCVWIIAVVLILLFSQMSFCHYTILYRRYGSIWFYMCSTILSPRTVLNGVINLLSYFCYQSKILVIS